MCTIGGFSDGVYAVSDGDSRQVISLSDAVLAVLVLVGVSL